jgi:hypothetical protein
MAWTRCQAVVISCAQGPAVKVIRPELAADCSFRSPFTRQVTSAGTSSFLGVSPLSEGMMRGRRNRGPFDKTILILICPRAATARLSDCRCLALSRVHNWVFRATTSQQVGGPHPL